MKIFDASLARLERSMDVRLARHGVLASNLANVDTPAYQPKDVDFEAAMAVASGFEDPTGGGDSGDMPLRAAVSAAPGLDGNGVDLDRTMAALAENALQYGASARAAGKKLAILRYVASDGNG